MDPSKEELATIKTIGDACDWIGLADDEGRNTRSSLLAALGKPKLLRHIVAIPNDAWLQAVAGWVVTEEKAEPGAAAAVPAAEAAAAGGAAAAAPAIVKHTGPPSAVERGQAGSLLRVARLVLGLSAVDPFEAGARGPGAGGGAALHSASGSSSASSASASSTSERKVKLSGVLDQADDSEAKPLAPDTIRALVSEWRDTHNDGEDPTEEEEATGDQLTALSFRLRSGAAPFCDFAVWRPYGARMGRLLKFQAFFQTSNGTFQTKELNGPSSLEEWRKSWRVFVFAMVVLKAARKSRLDRYEMRITKMAETYPNMWWVVGTADIRCRSEHLERVRRSEARAHEAKIAAGLPSEFDPAMPWDFVFVQAARDDAFWAEHVERKAVLFASRIRTPQQLIDEGFGQVKEVAGQDLTAKAASAAGVPDGGSGRGGGDRKRRGSRRSVSGSSERQNKKKKRKGRGARGDARPVSPPAKSAASGLTAKNAARPPQRGSAGASKRPDGRFYRNEQGKQLCWTWNHDAAGCDEPCRSNRAHSCEWCRQNHRSVNCPQAPAGWKP
jgi:hypothetical protein